MVSLAVELVANFRREMEEPQELEVRVGRVPPSLARLVRGSGVAQEKAAVRVLGFLVEPVPVPLLALGLEVAQEQGAALVLVELLAL